MNPIPTIKSELNLILCDCVCTTTLYVPSFLIPHLFCFSIVKGRKKLSPTVWVGARMKCPSRMLWFSSPSPMDQKLHLETQEAATSMPGFSLVEYSLHRKAQGFTLNNNLHNVLKLRKLMNSLLEQIYLNNKELIGCFPLYLARTLLAKKSSWNPIWRAVTAPRHSSVRRMLIYIVWSVDLLWWITYFVSLLTAHHFHILFQSACDR